MFIFSAVATPTGDPINLLLLATPILALVVVAVGISLLNDRRRARKSPDTDFSKLEDDEISPLEPDSI